MGNSTCFDERGVQHSRESGPGESEAGGSGASAWDDIEWLPCADGKARPTESGLHPLANGVPARAPKLRAYGNAIVPQVAAVFIQAFMDTQPPEGSLIPASRTRVAPALTGLNWELYT